MLQRHRIVVPLTLVLFLFGMAPSGVAPALADNAGQAEPPALSKLQAMVDNLGYPTELADDKQSFAIQRHGNYDYRMHFYLSQDGTLAYAYVNIDSYKPDQLTKLNTLKLLEASNVGDFYFSMENKTDGELLYANSIIPLAGLTPQSLRSLLDGLDDKLNRSAEVWDTSLWKK
jgi:hypothetical protein